MINFYKGNLFSPRLKISRYFSIAEALPALRPTCVQTAAARGGCGLNDVRQSLVSFQ